MAHLKDEIYKPVQENSQIYNQLFKEYLRLHDYFGRGDSNVMKNLKRIRDEIKGETH